MQMTPLHLEILFHWYQSNEPFRTDTVAVLQFTNELLNNEILNDYIPNRPGKLYEVSQKGKAYIEMILATPLPEYAYVDPRDGKLYGTLGNKNS